MMNPRQSEKLDWTKTSFPIEVSKIGKFERSNEGIVVNVYGYDDEPKKGVYPLRISSAYDIASLDRVIDLLLIEEGGIKHYCLIKNFSRLLSSQVSKDKRSKVFCRRCLNHFPNEEKLMIHDEYCRNNECVRLMLPSVKDDGSAPVLKFKNFVRKMKVTDVVYADFEALTEKISSCQPDPGRSYTHQYQKHEPCGFAYQVVCFDESVYSQEPVIYRMSEDDVSHAHSEGLGTGHAPGSARSAGHFVAQKFVDTLEENVRRLYRERDSSKKMIFTKSDRRKHLESTCCWICGSLLKNNKVRDHCPFTGKYRGAAHNRCNLHSKKPKFTPVVFHNLSGYDSHLFVKNLGKSVGDIRCIPNNEEKYISFSKYISVGSRIDKAGEEKPIMHELRFIDSAKFMASSLDSLVSNLVKSGIEKLKQTKKYALGARDERVLELLSRKGVYPYDYMDSVSRFSEKTLPPKEDFYSRLNDSHVSDEDHEHAQKVWKEFGCENMGTKRDRSEAKTRTWTGVKKRKEAPSKEIVNWQQDLADELHKPVRRNFTRRRVYSNGIDEIWAADLVEMQKFSKWNRGVRYLLMVIDVFSKFGWIEPLRDKKGETIAKAFDNILRTGRKPKHLWTDKGKEFYNKQFRDLLEEKGISLYSTENEEKSSVVERWNRTMKDRMWKMFSASNSTEYVDKLPTLLENYNETRHSSTKMSPIQAKPKAKREHGLLELVRQRNSFFAETKVQSR